MNIRNFLLAVFKMLTNIEGLCIYLDNILICDSTPDEHVNRLRLVLDKLSENNIKIDKNKRQINKDRLEF